MAALPKEAIAFAKSMGLNLNGLEPEAEDIWRKLNNLADSDPLQYHQFVAEQLKHGNDGDIQENNPKSENNRSFRPTSGFCVSSETIGGDGLMIREVANNGRHLSKGKTLFVNICSSLAVEKATDRSGKPVDSASVFRSADGLSIPLIVGAPRDFNFSDGIEGREQAAIAVDVVFNPIVIEMSQRSGMSAFRRQIVDLAMEWVGRETELQLSSTWTDVAEYTTTYRGGRGDTGDVPVLFIVTEEMIRGESEQTAISNKNGDKKSKDSALTSTSSLLSHIQKDTKDSVLDDLRIPSASQSIPKNQTKGGISLSMDKIISPEPSAANLPVATSKLVQELDANGEIIDKQVFKESVIKSIDAAGNKADKGLFGKMAGKLHSPASKSSAPETMPAATKPPSKSEYLMMESLVETADDEFSLSTNPEVTQMELATEQSMAIFSGLASMIGGSDMKLNSNHTKGDNFASIGNQPITTPSQSKLKITGDLALHHPVTVTFEDRGGVDVTASVHSGLLPLRSPVQLIITIGTLHSSLDPSSILLQVSTSAVEISLPCEASTERRTLWVDCSSCSTRLDATTAKAAFKKKKRCLVVSVWCLLQR